MVDKEAGLIWELTFFMLWSELTIHTVLPAIRLVLTGEMGFHDVAFLPSCASFSMVFLITCGRGEDLSTTTCLKLLFGVSKCLLPLRYFCSYKTPSLCLSNVMEIIRLSLR